MFGKNSLALLLYALTITAPGVQGADVKNAPIPRLDVVAGVALNVSDLERSVAFYKIIGLQDTIHLNDQGNRRVMFNVDQASAKFAGSLLLYEIKIKGQALDIGNGINRVLLIVSDLHDVCRRLDEAKMPCTTEPKVIPTDGNATIALGKDPDGYVLELIQLPR
jgi:catechol 2,3-dioxygenase-like lactoylglutathione lyase family enzyme